MGFLAAFFAIIVLMTPQSTIDLGGEPQATAPNTIVGNTGSASDSGGGAE